MKNNCEALLESLQSMLPLGLLSLLRNLLLLLGQRASSYTFEDLFVRSLSLGLGDSLLCTPLLTHFSAVLSVVIREV